MKLYASTTIFAPSHGQDVTAAIRYQVHDSWYHFTSVFPARARARTAGSVVSDHTVRGN